MTDFAPVSGGLSAFDRALLRGARDAGRPQFGVESGFEEGDGAGVGPRRALEDGVDDAVGDAGELADLSFTATIHRFPQVGGEPARDVEVGDAGVLARPRLRLVAGEKATGARHGASVEAGGDESVGLESTSGATSRDDGNYRRSGGGEKSVADVITDYASSRIPADQWAEIGPFVKACIADMTFESPIAARAALVALARHVHWCSLSGSLPLERDVLLRREVIAHSIAEGMREWPKRTRSTYRSRLFAISEALLSPHLRAPLVPSIGAFDAQAPYSDRQVTLLRFWAANQSTEHRRVQASLVLAFGLGAGLAAREMAAVRSADVDIDDAGVVVRVRGDRAREVPVRAEWEESIAVMAKSAMRPEQWLLIPNRQKEYARNLLSNFVSKTTDRPFDIRAARLRATWLVEHLRSGVPLRALTLAAGVDSPEALLKYVQYLPEVDHLEARRSLRALSVDMGRTWRGASR